MSSEIAANATAEPAPPTHAQWRQSVLTPRRAEMLERLRARGGEALEIAIFSTTTWRPLEPFLAGELLLEGFAAKFSFFEYEGMEAALAGLHTPFDCALLAIDDERSSTQLFDATRPWTEADAVLLRSQILERVDLVSAGARHTLVVEPAMPDAAVYPLERAAEGGTVRERVALFRRRMNTDLDSQSPVESLDPSVWDEEIGRATRFDSRLWHLGRIRYTEAGFARIARDVARRILHRYGRGLKAVIVDLDNTLWGGIVGEVGVGGIALGDGYPGACYLKLQEELRRWRDAGVLLAVASRNNPSDALAALDGHPAMLLKSADFAHLEIHWQDKAESVARILEAFNIAADAALFVDDNPRERTQVAAAHPTLRVLELSEDPIDYARALREIPWPLLAATSAEDRRRPELQQQLAARTRLLSDPATRAAHLRALEITVGARFDDPDDLARVAQLHAKTNQFNLDPMRLSEAEIRAAMEDRASIVAALRYRDRYGDAGLVGAAVARISKAQLLIETFLLSCRVIGLGIELALLHALARESKARGANLAEIQLPFRQTEKNAPARAFLEEIGAFESGRMRSGLVIATLPPVPEWIRCETVSPPQRKELLYAK